MYVHGIEFAAPGFKILEYVVLSSEVIIYIGTVTVVFYESK